MFTVYADANEAQSDARASGGAEAIAAAWPLGPRPTEADVLPVYRCSCGVAPTLQQIRTATHPGAKAKLYWVVRCGGCGSMSEVARDGWKAIANWDRSRASAKPALSEFPFFGLSSLPLRDARHRLNQIRVALEYQRTLARLKATPGGEHDLLARAYLAWAYVGFAVLANEEEFHAS